MTKRFYVPMFLEWLMPRKPGFTSKYRVNRKMDPVWGLLTICEVTYQPSFGQAILNDGEGE